MTRFNNALAIVLLAGIVSTPSARASLLGLDVTVTEYSPDLATVIAGPVGPVAISPVVDLNCCTLPENGTLEVTSNQIIYTAGLAETYGTDAFVGFVLDFSGAPHIVSVAQDPSSAFNIGFSFTADSVSMNFSGATSPFSGAQTILDVSTTVPEPSTWAMMLTGFAWLGFAGWHAARRRPREGRPIGA